MEVIMTHSYGGDLTDNDIDLIRFLLGDTDSSNWLMSDEELEGLVSLYGSGYPAAIQGAKAIAGKYSRLVTKTIGNKSISYSDLATQFWTLAKELESASKKAQFSSMTQPTISRVSDSENYPERFVHGEEQPVAWDLEEQ
jgi:hypothetical protein